MGSVASTFAAIQRGLDEAKSSRWRGPVCPFTQSGKGYFEARGTRSVILSSIINILETPLGTRIMLPQFGSRLPELVFEQNDEILAQMARTYIADALDRWEPRIRILNVDVFADQFRDDILIVRLTYTILQESVQEQVTLRVGPSGTPIEVEKAA